MFSTERFANTLCTIKEREVTISLVQSDWTRDHNFTEQSSFARKSENLIGA